MRKEENEKLKYFQFFLDTFAGHPHVRMDREYFTYQTNVIIVRCRLDYLKKCNKERLSNLAFYLMCLEMDLKETGEIL